MAEIHTYGSAVKLCAKYLQETGSEVLTMDEYYLVIATTAVTLARLFDKDYNKVSRDLASLGVII